ncbi:hypothetical protein SESBI_38980, partial [Sesbania bispinosa]
MIKWRPDWDGSTECHEIGLCPENIGYGTLKPVSAQVQDTHTRIPQQSGRQIQIREPFHSRQIGNRTGELVPAQQCATQHESNDRWRNLAGDDIVREVQDSESPELPDVARNPARDSVTGEVEDSERGERGNAGGDFAGNGLPVGDNECGEVAKVANLRRDFAGHVAGAAKLLEDWVFDSPRRLMSVTWWV